MIPHRLSWPESPSEARRTRRCLVKGEDSGCAWGRPLLCRVSLWGIGGSDGRLDGTTELLGPSEPLYGLGKDETDGVLFQEQLEGAVLQVRRRVGGARLETDRLEGVDPKDPRGLLGVCLRATLAAETEEEGRLLLGLGESHAAEELEPLRVGPARPEEMGVAEGQGLPLTGLDPAGSQLQALARRAPLCCHQGARRETEDRSRALARCQRHPSLSLSL